MLILNSLEILALVIFVYMTCWFFVALALKRNDVADIAWGMGFIVASLVTYFAHGIYIDRGLLVTTLVIIWGGRLSFHIFRRNIKKSEDSRYAAWRVEWGKWLIIRSYLQIFILQGALLMLIVSPVIIINTYRGGGITFFDFIGLLIWIIGFFFESKGDAELKAFLLNPENKTKILDTGLWKYTRHPNYFGEVTQWWGLWIMALSVPYGYIGIIGPLVITFLILKVSGIPMLERRMADNPLFDEYRKHTSVFFPLPRKK
jgi:steroid 5-alpha reductase family enzyme